MNNSSSSPKIRVGSSIEHDDDDDDGHQVQHEMPQSLDQELTSEFIHDIRYPAAVGINRRHILTIGRIIVLVMSDLIALILANGWLTFTQNWIGVVAINVEGDPQLLTAFSLILLGLVNGYGSDTAWRQYIAFTWVLLLASLISLLPNFDTSNMLVHNWGNAQWVTFFLLGWLTRVLLLCGGRSVIYAWVTYKRRQNIGRYNVAIVSESHHQAICQTLLSQKQRYRIVMIEEPTVLAESCRSDFRQKLLRLGVDEIFIESSAIASQLFLLQYLRASGVMVRLLPLESSLARLEQLEILTSPLTALTIPPDSPLFPSFLVKRIFDFVVALVLILLLSPLMSMVAILIKLDSPGPIVYRQVRVGLQGQLFKMWKFRSMVSNAAHLQEHLEQHNESSDGILFKIREDPRVTPFGKFMRRYSIDELPQLFNVICGQMSLVGPRPLPLRDVQQFSQAHFFIRHEVLPGITGAWQVSGRSDIQQFDEVVDLDLAYIANWSLGLDCRILLKTIYVVLLKHGAY